MSVSAVGLGTYAFFWQHTKGDMSLADMLQRTQELDVDLFQICDYAPMLVMSAAERAEIRALSIDLGVRLELGTRGIAVDHLTGFLGLAEFFGASVVRSMLFAGEHRPSLVDAERMLREVAPAYEAAGVTIALETYEQVPTSDLIAVIEAVDSASVRVCLDPANCVAALEHPRDVVERCAPFVANIHVKDFAFSRRDGWVGFTLAGSRFGEGLLDYEHLIETVRPDQRGITRIVEHWLPWQGDLEATLRIEDEWTRSTLTALKEQHP